jgi:hypothetical protein
MNNQNFQNMNMMAPRGGNGGSVQQNIIQHYRSQQQKAPPGWQQSLPPDERASLAMQFLTCYRLLKPEVSEQEIVRSSVQFETQIFMNSQTKDQYVSQIKSRLQNMQRLRQQRAQTVQNNLTNPMNPAQMGMMGQPGIQGQRQNPQQQFNQAFPNPQLQRPMQASPIPMSQGGSSMGMNAMNLQQGQNGQQPGQQQPQQQQPQIDNTLIMRLTQKLMQNVSEEVKQKFQQDVASWPAERRQQLMNQNIDPLMFRFRQHAEMMLRSGRANAAQLQGPQAGNQMGGPMQQPGQPNQMQNQQMNQRQSNQDFDFNAIANQQIEALRVQDQGQQVVPASNNVNGTQMGFPGQPPQSGQAQNLAQRQAAFQNANLQRQAQAQAQAQQQQQAQAQARAQQQMQQQQAAQQQAQAAQARNSNQMLHGQIGGLHQPGAAQSPAMSMLNRPLIPPGQTGPPTPQQQPQAHVPIMTPQMTQPQNPQVASQLIREVQQRQQAAAGGQAQPMTEQMRMSLIPAELNADTKQQLLKAPEAKFRGFIANYMQSVRRNQALHNGQFPGGQPQLGQPNMTMNPAQALQMGMPNAMMNNANMQNIGRVPGMNIGQTTPNGMNPQQLPMGQRPGVISQTQRLASAQSLLQQNPGIIKATDNRPFPPNIVNAQVKQSIPPDVKTWAQLKIWASQNPGLLPNMDGHKLLLLQVLHFQDFMRQAQQQQQLQQQNAIANGQLSQQNNPGVMAQAPQMPVAQLQQQQSMAGIQVSPQEIAVFRQRLPPNQVGATDQQLRQHLMQQKLSVRQQQQQAMMTLQAQRNQPQPQPQPQPPIPGQAPMAARPPPTQPLPAQQPAPQAKQTNKAAPAKPAQTPVQTMNKGVKRPNDDDVVVKSENNIAPQAPAMVPTRSQQGAPNLSPEQMSKLNAGQQQHVREQLLKAQSASQKQPTQRSLPPQEELQARMKDPAREQRYRALIAEEEKNTPRGQTVQTSPEVRAQLQALIKEKLQHIRKVDQALRIFLAGYEGGDGIEELARSVIKARVLLHRQINPADGTLQENLTLTEADFQKFVRHILGFVVKVMNSMQNQQGKNAALQNQQRAQPPQTQTQTAAQAARQPQQLNAANLKIVEDEHRNNRAPPAPTVERPQYPIGGQSPSGAPKYFEGFPKVTNLKLPQMKKPRFEGPTATHGKTAASPLTGANQGSPDLKRQQQQPEKPTFKCTLKDCEYHHRGFDTPTELETHISHAHAKIDDPVQFAVESMAEYLDMDPRTGQSKSDPSAANRTTKPPAVAARAIAPIKSAQTPNLSQSVTTPAGQMAATPMARSTSLLKTPQTGTKVGTPSTGAPAKATPVSTKVAMKEAEPPVKAEPIEELQPLIPASLFDYSYEDIYSALDANAPFTTLDLKDEDSSWALRSRPSSPINTPDSSSKDTPSTRQSDISENDNLLINIDVKDADMPDAWLGAAMSGNPLPLDAQLSADLMTLGVELPTMDADDMMLFYGDNAIMDLDAGGYGLDPVMYG